MRCLPPWRERVMISFGGGFPRAGRRCVGSEAVDPIGVALSITAGERSHPRTGPPHHSDPMGVELHTDVVRTAGFSVVTIGRAAASLPRRCACGLPAVIDVGPPWGPHIYMLPFRRFAFGSPAVIESSPPMGAHASRCVLRRGGPSAAWEFACVDTRYPASLTSRMAPRRGECRGGAAPRAGETR